MFQIIKDFFVGVWDRISKSPYQLAQEASDREFELERKTDPTITHQFRIVKIRTRFYKGCYRICYSAMDMKTGKIIQGYIPEADQIEPKILLKVLNRGGIPGVQIPNEE